jgi:hypothetical protein
MEKKKKGLTPCKASSPMFLSILLNIDCFPSIFYQVHMFVECI